MRPIPADKPLPALTFAFPQLSPGSVLLHQPGVDRTGPVPVIPPTQSLPMEVLIKKQIEQQRLKLQQQQQQQTSPGTQTAPFVPPAGTVSIGQFDRGN